MWLKRKLQKTKFIVFVILNIYNIIQKDILELKSLIINFVSFSVNIKLKVILKGRENILYIQYQSYKCSKVTFVIKWKKVEPGKAQRKKKYRKRG